MSDEAKRNRAVFCMAKDENFFLPVWLRYYSRFIPGEDIYVLDHLSDPAIMGEIRSKFTFNCELMDHPVYNDFPWYTGTVTAYQHHLLQRYETVLFSEPDELIVHTEGLGSFLDRFTEPAVRCEGWEVMQHPAEEKVLQPDAPIFEQRCYWHRNWFYDKTLIARVPLEWGNGFHQGTPAGEQEPGLYLLHLHKIDFLLAFEKNARVRSYNWAQRSIDLNMGFQCRQTDLREFWVWFFEESRQFPLVKIPEEIRCTVGV